MDRAVDSASLASRLQSADEETSRTKGATRVRQGRKGRAHAAPRRGDNEVRRIAGAQGGGLLHGGPRIALLRRTRYARRQVRDRGTSVAARGCCRHVLRDRLLSKVPAGAGAVVEAH